MAIDRRITDLDSIVALSTGDLFLVTDADQSNIAKNADIDIITSYVVARVPSSARAFGGGVNEIAQWAEGNNVDQIPAAKIPTNAGVDLTNYVTLDTTQVVTGIKNFTNLLSDSQEVVTIGNPQTITGIKTLASPTLTGLTSVNTIHFPDGSTQDTAFSGGGDLVTKASVDAAIGAFPTGDSAQFYNQQGNFVDANYDSLENQPIIRNATLERIFLSGTRSNVVVNLPGVNEFSTITMDANFDPTPTQYTSVFNSPNTNFTPSPSVTTSDIGRQFSLTESDGTEHIFIYLTNGNFRYLADGITGTLRKGTDQIATTASTTGTFAIGDQAANQTVTLAGDQRSQYGIGDFISKSPLSGQAFRGMFIESVTINGSNTDLVGTGNGGTSFSTTDTLYVSAAPSEILGTIPTFSYDPDTANTVYTNAALSIPFTNAGVGIATHLQQIGAAIAALDTDITFDGVVTDNGDATSSITIDLGTETNINSSFTLTGGLNNMETLVNTDGASGGETPSTTITVIDPEATEVVSFTSSVSATTDNNIADIAAQIVEAVNTNIETPINFNAEYDSATNVIVLTAQEAGNTNFWTIVIDNNGATAANAGDLGYTSSQSGEIINQANVLSVGSLRGVNNELTIASPTDFTGTTSGIDYDDLDDAPITRTSSLQQIMLSGSRTNVVPTGTSNDTCTITMLDNFDPELDPLVFQSVGGSWTQGDDTITNISITGINPSISANINVPVNNFDGLDNLLNNIWSSLNGTTINGVTFSTSGGRSLIGATGSGSALINIVSAMGMSENISNNVSGGTQGAFFTFDPDNSNQVYSVTTGNVEFDTPGTSINQHLAQVGNTIAALDSSISFSGVVTQTTLQGQPASYITINLGTTTDLSSSFSIFGGGLNTESFLENGNPIPATTVVIRDGFGTQVGSFSSSVLDSTVNNVDIVGNFITGIVNSVTESPINFTASYDSGSNIISIEAENAGETGSWDIDFLPNQTTPENVGNMFASNISQVGIVVNEIDIITFPDGTSQTTAATAGADGLSITDTVNLNLLDGTTVLSTVTLPSSGGTTIIAGTTGEIVNTVSGDTNTLSLATAITGAITANTNKVSFPGLGTTSTTALAGNTRIISNTEITKLGNIAVTQAVDLDTIESDTATNNAKITYPASASTKLGTIETNADVTDKANVDTAIGSGTLATDYYASDKTWRTLPTGATPTTVLGTADEIDVATVTSTATVSLSSTITDAIDLNTAKQSVAGLNQVGAAVLSTDSVVYYAGTALAPRRKTFSLVPLSIMNNDSGFTTNTGTVTSVTGTANQINVANGTTTPVISLNNTITSAITANTAKVTYPTSASTKLGTIETNADVTDKANVDSSIGTGTLTTDYYASDKTWKTIPSGGGGDAVLANTQTFTGQNTFSDTAIFSDNASSIQVASIIAHQGDTDTFIGFTDNRVDMRAGNVSGLSLNTTRLLLNPVAVDLDFTVNGNGKEAFSYDSGTDTFDVNADNITGVAGSETGTWTPTFTNGGTQGTTTATYSKVGQTVTLSCVVALAAGGASGLFVPIATLPFSQTVGGVLASGTFVTDDTSTYLSGVVVLSGFSLAFVDPATQTFIVSNEILGTLSFSVTYQTDD